MKVKELIDHLSNLPQEKDVLIFWDGDARSGVDGIVNSSDEVVIVADWSIYRSGDAYRAYPESEIIFG